MNGPRHQRSQRRMVRAGTLVARTAAATAIVVSATALAMMTTAPTVNAAAEEPDRRRHGPTATTLAAAAQAESALERRSRERDRQSTWLAPVIASIQRPFAVAARLLRRPLDDRCVYGDKPLKKLDPELECVEHSLLLVSTTRRRAPRNDLLQVFWGAAFVRPSKNSIRIEPETPSTHVTLLSPLTFVRRPHS
jgi:hypothetical protein